MVWDTSCKEFRDVKTIQLLKIKLKENTALDEVGFPK